MDLGSEMSRHPVDLGAGLGTFWALAPTHILPTVRQALRDHIDPGLGRARVDLHRGGSRSLRRADVEDDRAGLPQARPREPTCVEGADQVDLDDGSKGVAARQIRSRAHLDRDLAAGATGLQSFEAAGDILETYAHVDDRAKFL